MRSIKRLMFSLSSNFPVLISLAILFIKVLEYSPKVFPFSKKKASLYKLKILHPNVCLTAFLPRGAAHVGPQSELIADAKTDLLEFIKHDDLPVVAQCAITYAQFETIILRVSRLKNEVHFNSDITSRIKNDLTRLTRAMKIMSKEKTMTDRKSIENRYDFTILFDVKDGNPNGDPDSGNMPRVDIETGNGLVTDVCIKRKIRDYVQTAMGEQTPWRIYIQNRRTLNRLDSEALEAEHIDARPEDKDFAKEIKSLKKDDPTLDLRLRDYMCSQFFDIRTFGAVMTTFVKGSLSCGQVRGPVQLGFARSIDPVSVQEISLTRIAVTTEADAADKNNTMGNKFIIPYGLYRMNGYISAKLAQNVTGFCDDDLDMLWQAILNMFEFDRSAARGNMAVRKLYVFKHSSALGDAPSWKLFDSINVHKRDGADVARNFSDYEVQVNREAIPDSVSVSEMVDHTL